MVSEYFLKFNRFCVNYLNFSLIDVRDLYTINFKTQIIGIISKNELNNNTSMIYLVNIVPYLFTFYILSLLNVKYIYKRDDIISYSYSSSNKIIPLLLSIKLEKYNSINNVIDLKDIFKIYENNVPIYIIFKNENIHIVQEDKLYIKYIKQGKICEKKTDFKKIKYYLKSEIFN